MQTYRRDRSWAWNLRHGPRWSGPLPRVQAVAPTDRLEVLGSRIDSPLGVAAGLLLGSRWVELYARLGFGLLTYKTVRSRERPCYPLPNWLWVDAPRGGLDPTRDQILRVARRRPSPAETTSAVCFGMPSVAPSVWRRDVRESRRFLGPGQTLVVSVVGTPGEGGDPAELAEDFARCARWAAEAGADMVEANFSCPNVCTPEGSVYEDATLSARLAAVLRDALPSTPLLIKCGHHATESALRDFYRAVARHADAVVLVNGVARRVVDASGRPAFGPHDRVGILGRAIRPVALETVRRASEITEGEALPIATLAVGGVTSEHDAAPLLGAGAAAVLLGGAPMLDPLIAVRHRRAAGR